MTPQQTLNAWLLLGPVGVVFVAEMVLLVAFPAALARLAYLPLGRARNVLLTPAARALLSTGATYRAVAAGSFALSEFVAPNPFKAHSRWGASM